MSLENKKKTHICNEANDMQPYRLNQAMTYYIYFLKDQFILFSKNKIGRRRTKCLQISRI